MKRVASSIILTPETQYVSNTSLEHRKKYAQFFTPDFIADIMSDWILKCEDIKLVLDPAFGLGVFARELNKKKKVSIKGFEVDEIIYKSALNQFNNSEKLNLILQDYMFNDWKNKYDGIICNPPYLKFHDYDNKAILKELEQRLGYKLSGASNLYVLFLLKSIYQLSENGFLTYIIPSEFMNSDYGVKIKEILIKTKVLRHIAIVDFNENVFDDAITTSTILFCSKDKNNKYVKFSTIQSMKDLNDLKLWISKYPEIDNKDIGIIEYNNLLSSVKWRKYYQLENAKKYKNLVPFTTFANVKRGIATGSNEFFTFNKSKQKKYSIPDNVLCPCLCKSQDINDIFFTNATFKNLVNKDKNVYIFKAEQSKNNINVKKYLAKGEKDGINSLYLTSKRSPWFSIEKREIAPIWVSVFNRNGVKFIKNETGSYNLTTFHCVYPTSIINEDLLFAYLITDVAKQIFDDSRREYGNGLKKFEPNDLNKAQVLDLTIIDKNTEQNILNLLYEYKKDKKKIKNISKINEIFEEIFTNK